MQTFDGFPGNAVSLDDCQRVKDNVLLKVNEHGQKQCVLLHFGSTYYAVVVNKVKAYDNVEEPSKVTLFIGDWYAMPEKGLPFSKRADFHDAADFAPEYVVSILPQGYNTMKAGQHGIYEIVAQEIISPEAKPTRYKMSFPDILPVRKFLETEASINKIQVRKQKRKMEKKQKE